MPRRVFVWRKIEAAVKEVVVADSEKVAADLKKGGVADSGKGAVVGPGKDFRARRLARFVRDNRGRNYNHQPLRPGLWSLCPRWN